jgi:hypothetical protein
MNAPQDLPSPDVDLLGVSPPEHGLPGRALMVLLYMAAPAAAFSWALTEWQREDPMPAVGFTAIVFAFGTYLAESLRRFECWSWFFTMPLLTGVVLTLLAVMADSAPREAVGFAGLCAPVAAWMHYLWTRRWQFWSDGPSRPAPRSERWVTPEWRAARLAGMARTRAGALEGAVHGTRPDTLSD